MPPTICLIAAVARKGAIGIRNTLPWRLPEDLRHFKRLTLGHSVIMGRKTFESLGRPLPERTNIILSREHGAVPDGCLAARSLEAALALCASEDVVFVIGGAQIYQLAIASAHRLYLTEIDLDVPDADAWFPSVDPAHWLETSRDSRYDDANACKYDFVIYERMT